MKKKVVLSLLAGLCISSLAFSLAACGEEGKKDDTPEQGGQQEQPVKPEEQPEQGGQQEQPEQGGSQDEEVSANAPVYLGMSIESAASPQTIMPSAFSPVLWTQGSEIYHSRVNSDVFFTIHFDNPQQFEIMSFTLDGKKYANNMFEDDSDLENIILKVSVGEFEEMKEYTIDAIKYVDGEAFKNVKIGGDKTVKLYRDYVISYHDTFDAPLPTDYTIVSDTVSFEDLSRTGYTFEGFFGDENYENKVDSIAKGSKGDREIFAKWEINTYKIEYDLDGGENAEENPVSFTVEDKVEFQKASKEGNIFLGWYRDEEFQEPVSALESATGDLKLYASFVEGSEGLLFEEREEGFAVTGYQGESKNLIIPDSYLGGKPVTTIKKEAFKGFQGMESVLMGVNINKIEENAFQGWYYSHQTEIKDMRAWLDIEFENGSSNPLSGSLYLDGEEVSEVVVPDSVTKIKNWTFKGCESMKKITIPESVTSIGEYAFYESGLESITIPDSVTEIGAFMCNNCHSLKSITLGKGLKKIETHAFAFCSTLNQGHLEGEEIVVTYTGTVEEWEKIEIESSVFGSSIVKTIHCSNGEAEVPN